MRAPALPALGKAQSYAMKISEEAFVWTPAVLVSEFSGLCWPVGDGDAALHIGTVRWEMFLNTEAAGWKGHAFKLLKEVKLVLSTYGFDGSFDEVCRDHLENEDTFFNFLSPMKLLEKVDIPFDYLCEDSITCSSNNRAPRKY